MPYVFEWDPEKDAANFIKHGVTFVEASTVFGDPLELTVADARHSEQEYRYFTLGRSQAERLLAVSYTERAGRIRISARLATPRERRDYEGP